MSILHLRQGQRQFLREVETHRLMAFLARRQYGKTTTFAKLALKKMMKRRNHTVIFGSAKLNLSREIVRKEAEIIQAAIAEAIEQSAAVRMADAQKDIITGKLSADDFADLFEAQRLEFRYYHTRSSYSRTKVVALRPYSVGETGDLMCDEIGRIDNWKETWEAVSPISASNPEFRVTLCTTIPPDDTHYSFEQLIPQPGVEFQPNPAGNLYVSAMGFTVLRVDAWDAWADNVPLYDLHSGEALPPEESRRRDPDKDSWDRNYGLRFIMGGASACGLLQMQTAQARGVRRCKLFVIQDESDFQDALAFIPHALGFGTVGIGFDVATTTKGSSNPSALSIVEQSGVNLIVPAVLLWKTTDPAVARARIKSVVQTIAARPAGGRARSLAVDATNEKYFARDLRRHLVGDLPVHLIVASETLDVPGYPDPITYKQHLGTMLVSPLDDNRLTLPPEKYLLDDWRLVKKEKGQFVCEPNSEGQHGDTFDSTKLGIHAITRGGKAEASAAPAGTYPTPGQHRRPSNVNRPDHSTDHAHPLSGHRIS